MMRRCAPSDRGWSRFVTTWPSSGPGFVPALIALLFGSVLYRSRLVPRIIPAPGLIGAPLLAASAIGAMFGLHDQSVFAAIALAPIFVWELSIGMWMTVRGFNPPALAALGFESDASAAKTM
jgi:Domain of unknown function (DUF4386)